MIPLEIRHSVNQAASISLIYSMVNLTCRGQQFQGSTHRVRPDGFLTASNKRRRRHVSRSDGVQPRRDLDEDGRHRRPRHQRRNAGLFAGSGGMYIAVHPSGAMAAQRLASIEANYQAELASSGAGLVHGTALGVTETDFANEDFGWVQVRGLAEFRDGGASSAGSALTPHSLRRRGRRCDRCHAAKPRHSRGGRADRQQCRHDSALLPAQPGVAAGGPYDHCGSRLRSVSRYHRSRDAAWCDRLQSRSRPLLRRPGERRDHGSSDGDDRGRVSGS